MADNVKIIAGGQNRTDILPITKTTSVDGVVSYTVGTTLAHTYNSIEKVGVEPQEDGSVKLTITQVEDTPELDAHLETYARATSADTTTITEGKFENAAKYGGSTATSTELIAIVYGAKQPGTDGKYKVTIVHGQYPKTIGGWETDPENPNKPTIEIIGVKSEAEITIPVGCFKDIVEPAEKKLAKSRGWLNVFMAKKTVTP